MEGVYLHVKMEAKPMKILPKPQLLEVNSGNLKSKTLAIKNRWMMNNKKSEIMMIKEMLDFYENM